MSVPPPCPNNLEPPPLPEDLVEASLIIAPQSIFFPNPYVL